MTEPEHVQIARNTIRAAELRGEYSFDHEHVLPICRAIIDQHAQIARLKEGLREALDGWAVWANGDPGLHPERPDSITDAEISDQGKITKLRKLAGEG